MSRTFCDNEQVARCTPEIGIRIAFGVGRSDVLRLVMRPTLLLIAIGAIVGMSAALAATQYLSSLLFGLTPTDPLTIVMAALLLTGVAAVSGYPPPRRASPVDPMVALRYDERTVLFGSPA